MRAFRQPVTLSAARAVTRELVRFQSAGDNEPASWPIVSCHRPLLESYP